MSSAVGSLYAQGKADFEKEFKSCLKDGSVHPRTVFEDWCEMCSITLQQQTGFDQEREDRYLAVVNKYPYDVRITFPKMLANLILAYHDAPEAWGDFLGEFYMNQEFSNSRNGEFFTPYHLSRMMAELTMGTPETLRAHVAEKGYMSINDPCCGAGCMMIAAAAAASKAGLDTKTETLFYAVDVNRLCANMAFIQLCALGVPAIVYHGNTLSNEMWEHFVTPALLTKSFADKLEWRVTHGESNKPSLHVPFAEIFRAIALGAASKLNMNNTD